MTMDRQTIIDKISALKRKSEDGGCTESEATMFATKVAELMEKHTVSMYELGEKPDHVKDKRDIKYMGPWRRILLNECAGGCFCICVLHGGKSVSIVGRPLNVEATYEMFYFIEKQIVLIARELYVDTKAQRRAEGGLGVGIARKINASKLSTQEARMPVVQEKEAAMKSARSVMPNLREGYEANLPKETIESIVGEMNAERINIRENIT